MRARRTCARPRLCSRRSIAQERLTWVRRSGLPSRQGETLPSDRCPAVASIDPRGRGHEWGQRLWHVLHTSATVGQDVASRGQVASFAAPIDHPVRKARRCGFRSRRMHRSSAVGRVWGVRSRRRAATHTSQRAFIVLLGCTSICRFERQRHVAPQMISKAAPLSGSVGFSVSLVTTRSR